MKRLLLSISLSAAVLWSACAMAENVGVVDMRQVFSLSPQIKKINAQLKKQFAPQKGRLMAMGKSLQGNVQKLQKNQSIMDKKGIDALKATIVSQEKQLRATQGQLQQALFAAQNQAMSSFMQKLTGVVKTVAMKKKLDVVFPKNSLLYAKGSTDITSDVASDLK